MCIKTKIFIIILFFLLTADVIAWDGYDYDNASYIEIEKENLVRKGKQIEFYDYEKGYDYLDVDTVKQRGSKVIIEGTDSSGEQREFEMDSTN